MESRLAAKISLLDKMHTHEPHNRPIVTWRVCFRIDGYWAATKLMNFCFSTRDAACPTFTTLQFPVVPTRPSTFRDLLTSDASHTRTFNAPSSVISSPTISRGYQASTR